MTVPEARMPQRFVLAAALLPLSAILLMVSLENKGQVWFMLQMLLQDSALLLLQLGVLALAMWPLRRTIRLPVLTGRGVAILALALIAITYAGHYLVMAGYNLIRDEQMTLFDAAIYAEGKLAWPIPPEWRSEAGALNLTFMLPVDQPVAWVSGYLPGNAALHALVSLVADPALTGPLLSALALAMMWSCSRKLWPDDPEVASVCTVLLLVSGQFLFSGMSPWAMQAHLACNLVFLRLFLADRRGADLAAIALGWLATGLHQPLFHPLFVGPLLLVLLHQRRFARFAMFAIGYGAIGLFWLSWPKWTIGLVAGPGSVIAASGVDFFSRLSLALASNESNLGMMAANLLRFVAWQHVLLLPMLAYALGVLRHNRMALALLAGPAATILIIALILPWQGYGFGYRYLHGQLAGIVLLAGFGWQKMREQLPGANTKLALATAASLALVIPFQALLINRIYAAYADADRAIAKAGTDYFLVDNYAGYVADILVINRPDLANRPLRLMAIAVRDPAALARQICKPGTTLALGSNAFYRRIDRAYTLPSMDRADGRMGNLKAPYEQAGCRIVVID